MIILATAALAADLSLLRPVTGEGYRAEPFDAPYLAVFDNGRKRLVFVSGDHGHGKDSAVARTIKQAMNEHKPGVVVVEGISPDHIDSIPRSAPRELRDSPKTISGAMYSAYLAGRAGIPIATGELRDREEFEFLRKAGYTIEDYVFYYMAASIPSWRADGRLNNPRFRKDAARDRPREEAIVRSIQRVLNHHDRVLVVYGSGHLVKQRKVWKALLGPSRDSKPY